jgi:hypothetical protein
LKVVEQMEPVWDDDRIGAVSQDLEEQADPVFGGDETVVWMHGLQ